MSQAIRLLIAAALLAVCAASATAYLMPGVSSGRKGVPVTVITASGCTLPFTLSCELGG